MLGVGNIIVKEYPGPFLGLPLLLNTVLIFDSLLALLLYFCTKFSGASSFFSDYSS